MSDHTIRVLLLVTLLLSIGDGLLLLAHLVFGVGS
jgi:hypothetical protein